MTESLQYAFFRSHGQPVLVGQWIVRQADRIPIDTGRVTVRFVKGKRPDHGIRLKANGGWIELSDHRRVATVDIWREPCLPDVIEHRVCCPTGELGVWNIYRVRHPNGTVTEDMWTGNAGMVLLEEEPTKRTYGCSSGIEAFDPSELVVQIEWQPEP
jgi:hypothetical protein